MLPGEAQQIKCWIPRHCFLHNKLVTKMEKSCNSLAAAPTQDSTTVLYNFLSADPNENTLATKSSSN